MKCKYDYCIYNKKSTCILNEIQVDSLGMCVECETVYIPSEKLQAYKKKRLKEIKEFKKNLDK